MIRFLNLTGQIIECEPSFAFYDTASEVILVINETQVFSSVEQLISDHYEDMDCPHHINRFLEKIPNEFFE